MRTIKVSRRKLDNLEFECFQNALRLHFDSVLLANARSFNSAFAISVLASEELGKGFALAEIAHQTRMGSRYDDRIGQRFLKALFSDHKIKQGWFAREAFDFRASAWKRYETIQIDKNNALYVGVRSGNHHIIRPFMMSASKAKKQIGIVGRFLINFVEGSLADAMWLDDVSEQLFRRRSLLNKLRAAADKLR